MVKKVFFWINGFLLDFCVANSLQKKIDAEFYGVIDATNNQKKFFQEQEFVDFNKKWFYFDHVTNFDNNPDIQYLENFEKKYNIPLWKLAINERIFYRFNRLYKFQRSEILSILEKECKFYEKILDEVNPDFLITYDPPLHHQKLFYDLCIAKGIKVLGLYITRVGNKCIIAENGKTLDLKNEEYGKDRNRNLVEIQQELKSNYNNVIKNYLKGRESTFGEKLTAVNSYILKSNSENVKTHYSYFGRTKIRVLNDLLNISIKKMKRKNFIDKNLKKEIDEKSPFFYLPLAVDEESNLLNYAPYYTNQVEVIRHIAKSMPIKYRLYVKEHPGQKVRGWRNISEYKEIMEIPNVELIHPSVSSEILYKNCSLVLTVRGTSGLEAVFHGKPSIIFGDLSYSMIPSVYKVNSIEELSNTIRTALEKPVNVQDLDKYITLIEEKSFDFDFLGYENLRSEYFYPGRLLSDVEIQKPKMDLFLKEFQKIFDDLSNEFLNKMNINQNR